MPDAQIAPTVRDDASAARARRSRGRARFNRAMKLVRRLHLYAGLAMTPWVFLYGVTALLYNHPGAFSDRDVRTIGPDDLAETPLATFPRPQDLAGRVVAAINAREAGGSPDAYRLVRPDAAQFSRDYAVTATAGDRECVIRLDLGSRSGTVLVGARRQEAARPDRAPFAGREGLRLDPPPLEGVAQSLPKVLSRLGLTIDPLPTPRPAGGRTPPEGRGGEVATTRPSGPELSFLMEGRGQTWRVGYNLQSGALTGRPVADGAAEPLSMRRFLTRLHLAHGYPAQLGPRWAWAVAVDLMFASMVGWGATGLLMWWQMKNLRRVGLVVLVFSLVAATAMTLGMHVVLTS